MSAAKFISYSDCVGIECVSAMARVVNNACIQCDWFCIILLNYGYTVAVISASGIGTPIPSFRLAPFSVCVCVDLWVIDYIVCARLMAAILLFSLFKYFIEIRVPILST